MTKLSPVVTEKTASEILQDIQAIAQRQSAERIRIGDLLQGAGARLYGLALLVFALPEAIPFPAVGLTGLIAIPIAVVALTMMFKGMHGELPGWIRRRYIRRDWAINITRRGASLVHRIERFSHPRYTTWTEYGRPLGLLCLCLSAVMAVPIPFSNVAPGVTVVAIGLGIFQRDGLLVAVAASIGVLILGTASLLIVLGGRLVL
ncbi:exopolysaccharide biosynthesis protein [Alkalilimnicola ehrlichii]|uniref:exopolysaccharide biosynthesis protein n=1 Tax=Alkalilimnicola ehrlichii TaxID=351052 RepID=UPI0015F28C48|nr:exopolysaccharide biosynthesis protein [Alkalilimnicola ehrlichii]